MNIFVCHNCWKVHSSWKKCCGKHTTLHIKENFQKASERKLNMFDPFTPYVEENLGADPVFIGSREERKRLLKERKMEIVPASNKKVSAKPMYFFMK